MSGTKGFMLNQAETWANEVRNIFLPLTEGILIAGSIRRRQPYVGDVELVVNLDRKKIVPFSNALYQHYKVGMKRDSRYIKFFHDRIQIDMFIPVQEDRIRQEIIRTGSADFVHNKIAKAWRKAKWVGTEDGLRRESECNKIDVGKGKFKWICTSTGSNITLPPHIDNERDFFAWLGVKYVLPCDRF